MKTLLLLLSCLLLTACSSGSQTEIPEAQTPIETTTETPTSVIESEMPQTTEVPTPEQNPPSTEGTEATPLTYYDELRARCSTLTEEKQAGCAASVTQMQEGGYKEADYNSEGEKLPCSEGLQNNTIRSPGSLTWCEPITQ